MNKYILFVSFLLGLVSTANYAKTKDIDIQEDFSADIEYRLGI